MGGFNEGLRGVSGVEGFQIAFARCFRGLMGLLGVVNKGLMVL